MSGGRGTAAPRRVLLTGSSGFLGAAIAARLVAEGHEVTGLDPAPPATGAGHRHLGDDLSDPTRLAGLLAGVRPEAVIHAGGVSGPMVLPDEPWRVMEINLQGSLNLLRASLAAGVGSFVFCSSTSAIGEFLDGPLPDDAPMRPNTPYGASKAAVDQAIAGLFGRVPAALVSLRYTAIYGAGRRTPMPIGEVIAAALAGRPARVPSQPPWPYIHVEDAAEAAILASLGDPARRRQPFYHIAHPELVSLAQVAGALRDLGLPVELREDPTLPGVARGPLAVEAARRELGFSAALDHRAGIARAVGRGA